MNTIKFDRRLHRVVGARDQVTGRWTMACGISAAPYPGGLSTELQGDGVAFSMTTDPSRVTCKRCQVNITDVQASILRHMLAAKADQGFQFRDAGSFDARDVPRPIIWAPEKSWRPMLALRLLRIQSQAEPDIYALTIAGRTIAARLPPPKAPTARRLSGAQRRMLENVDAGATADAHIGTGASERGGAVGTKASLARHQLITSDGKALTSAGRRAIRKGVVRLKTKKRAPKKRAKGVRR